jgi:hypothetical protein
MVSLHPPFFLTNHTRTYQQRKGVILEKFISDRFFSSSETGFFGDNDDDMTTG